MNKTLLLLSAAATLAATSCSQDKPAADTAVVVNEANAGDAANDTAAYRTEADRLAARVAEDLKLTDTVVVTRIEKTYYTRGRRLTQARTQYATDTTGRYAALRQINDDTDREVKTVITDPKQYDAYAANRGTYYAGTPYTVVVREEGAQRRGPAVVKYDKKANGETKIVYADGKTVKVDKDGDRKVEYPNGTKVKRDADDGQVKVKD